MHARGFEYVSVTQVISDEQGKFQFTDLEPGWYMLKAEHDGYFASEAKFWVARDDITKVSPILMHPRSGVVNESGDKVSVQCYNCVATGIRALIAFYFLRNCSIPAAKSREVAFSETGFSAENAGSREVARSSIGF